MSVNSENHVLGLWIGGGVTAAALKHIASAIEYELELKHEHNTEPQWSIAPSVRLELENIVNSCHAQLTKIPEPPKLDPLRYL